MYARVTKASGHSSEEDVRRFVEERAVPGMSSMDGFAGGYWLYDRNANRVLAVTLWESEDQLRRSDEEARGVRDEATARINAQFESVETYEVIAQETPIGTGAGSRSR